MSGTRGAISTSERVARNGALNLGALVLPAVAAVFLVPVTIRALGAPRFGLLALAWALAEGAGMFDFGLARTTVRFVADATVRGAERLREIILLSILTQTAAGLLAGALLFALAPSLVRHAFTIPPAEIPEAIAMFRVLAFHVPVLLALAALRAALEGAQRFDVSTALRLPGSLASIVVPAIAARAGASLPTILWILLGIRVALLLSSATLVKRTLLPGRWGLPAGFGVLREMLGYSGWVAVTAAIGPVIGSVDRFVVRSVVGVAGLGYYTGAIEAATRFLLIPSTAFNALLPALANTEILRAWLGPVFAQQAGPALRILAVGVFLGGLAHLPLAVLYGAGRPDLPAKIHIGEVIAHVPLTFLLVKAWGITGAALSWTLRCGADWLLYEIATRRAIGRSAEDIAEEERLRSLLWLTLAFVCSLALMLWVGELRWSLVMALFPVALLAYGFVGWSKVLSDDERSAWLGMLSRARVRS